MIRAAAAAVLAVAALSACMSPPAPPAHPASATPPAGPAPSAPSALSARSGAAAAQDRRAHSAAAPDEPATPDIETLKGEASAQVTSLLGQPDFRRADKPAELWQYRSAACSVDLFLYPGDAGALTVDHLDVRTFGEEALSRQACFAAILKSRAADRRG